MLNLPNFTPILKGEALFSWIVRLADINAIDVKSLVRLIDRYHSYYIPWFKYSYLYNSAEISKMLGEDQFSVFANRTNYLALAPFMSTQKVFNVHQLGMVPGYDYLHLLGIFRYRERTSCKVCPECLKETGIVREIHQLQSVRICDRHHIPLHRLVNSKKSLNRGLFDISHYQQLDVDKNDYLKSEMVYYLAKNPIDINSSQYHKFCIYNKIYDDENIEMAARINSLYKHFKSADILSNALESFIRNNPYEIVIPEDYMPVSDVKANLVEVIHKSCGTRFMTSPVLLNKGIGCPVCANSNPNGELDRILAASAPDYKRSSDFDEVQKDLKIIHSCGYETSQSIQSIISGKIKRCQCWLPASAKKINDIDGYKVVYYSQSGYDKPYVTILHEECGESFDIQAASFLKQPFCRACIKNAKKKAFADRLNNKGFKVINYEMLYDKKLAHVKCSNCGEEYLVYRTDFSKKPLCEKCGKIDRHSKKNDLKKLFSQTKGSLSIKDLMEKTSMKYNTLNIYLNIFLKEGCIERISKGVYKWSE